MNQMMVLSVVAAALASATACGDDFEAKRLALLDRQRDFIYNTDGNDMLRYTKRKPVTVDGFESQRLDYTKGTAISSVSYCPAISFAYFTLFRAGYPATNSIAQYSTPDQYCGATAFWEKGLDNLSMAIDFAHRNGMLGNVSIRMNDSHDSWVSPIMRSPFKNLHPECMMESSPPQDKKPRYGTWTSVDYSEPLVQEEVRKFVRQFCENYDIDCLELDFCRHLVYLRSVYFGGIASEEETESINALMREIRGIVANCGKKRGRPIIIQVRVADSPEYCRELGLDIRSWMEHKYVDAVIGGCYFRLNDWGRMADLAHSYGVRFYASMDETRIPWQCRHNKPASREIPGRGSVAFDLARCAEAMNAGCDGIFMFNIEGRELAAHTKVAPRETDGLDKIYFATERGGGGYSVKGYLNGGIRHRNLAYIDPSAPLPVEPKQVVAFGIRIGDNFAKAAAKGLKPVVVAMALTGRKESKDVRIVMNGKVLSAAKNNDGLFFYPVEPALVKKGINSFYFANLSSEKTTFNDFAVSIYYVKREKGERSAGQ